MALIAKKINFIAETSNNKNLLNDGTLFLWRPPVLDVQWKSY